jgi:hypothetical protein
MKKELILVLLVMAFYLSACISKKEQEVAGKLQTQLNATEFKIGHGDSINSSTGSHHFVELEFMGVSDNEMTDYAASKAAFYFFKNVSQNDGKYDQIKIVMRDGKREFERLYEYSNIQLLDTMLQEPINKFFSLYKSDSVKYLIEDNMLSDSDLHTIINGMCAIDSIYGAIKDIQLKGFDFKHLEGTEIPVAVLLLDVKNGEAYTSYKFFVLMATKKIFYIQINEKKAS